MEFQHPLCLRANLEEFLRAVQLQVWKKPHITMPAGATLWGALGYEEGNDKLEQAVLARKQRKEKDRLEEQKAEELVSALNTHIVFCQIRSDY